MSDSLLPPGLYPTRLLCPWDSPGENIGMGCHFLLQGIFLTQGSNSCLFHLLHCRQILYHLSHQGSLHLHINIQEHRFEFEPISDNLGMNPQVLSLGWEDPLEKEMAAHSSIHVWKNPIDRGAWWATVHGVTNSQTQLSNFTFKNP